MRALVTGANRGIGLELVRQLRARGDTVDAACRRPEDAAELRALAGPELRVHRCDVSDDASVRAFAAELGDAAIDLVVNNAGISGGSHQSLRDLDFADAVRTYQVDALGPLRVAIALLPHVRRGTGKKLVAITSGLGSIADNRSGGFYGYRMAKAALNMMAKNLAVELRGDGIVSIVVNPGWVQTDMGGRNAAVPAADSVRGILGIIDAASLETSGEFFDWKGGRYPW
ncbi:MAG TPA: SDR family oxidoreductase [Kofleriaceae bacterium]|nr:SDR family oxidoreductase [Kofleriaceae bacterium]